MTLKLLGLNTWGRSGPWSARRTLIADGIRALDPQIIGLAEIWEDADGNTADELARSIGGDWHVHYGPAFEVDGHTEGNAVLSRFPISEREVWPLPEPTGDHGRNLVFAMIASPWGAIPVFATHLSWMMHWSAARLQQVMQIREWMKERAPVQHGQTPADMLPPILIGDLNAPPESDEIRFLTGLLADPYGCYLADCFAWCGEGRGFTWERRNTFAAEIPLPDRRIDYVLVRGPDRWRRGEPLVARVALTEPKDGVFPSDHYAVYVELRATPVVRSPR